MRDELSELLEVLDDRERKIIFKRFGLDGGKPTALQCPQVLPDRLGGNPKRQSALGLAAVHTPIAASLEQRKDRAIVAWQSHWHSSSQATARCRPMNVGEPLL